MSGILNLGLPRLQSNIWISVDHQQHFVKRVQRMEKNKTKDLCYSNQLAYESLNETSWPTCTASKHWEFCKSEEAFKNQNACITFLAFLFQTWHLLSENRAKPFLADEVKSSNLSKKPPPLKIPATHMVDKARMHLGKITNGAWRWTRDVIAVHKQHGRGDSQLNWIKLTRMIPGVSGVVN